MPQRSSSVRLAVEGDAEFGRKFEEAGSRGEKSLRKVGTATDDLDKRLRRLTNAIDPVARSTGQFTAGQDLLNKALAAGRVTQEEHGRLLGLLDARYTTATRSARGLTDAFRGVYGIAARVAGVFGIALGAQALVSFGRQMLEAGGGLGELSQQLGVGTELLQSLQYGATQAGVSTDELETGLRKLTQTIGDAANGSKTAIAAFDRIGVKLLDVNGKLRPTDDVMRDVADAISKIEDPAKRASAIVDLMGRSGQKLLPLMTDGAAGIDKIRDAAQKAGVVLSDDMIQRMDDASDAVDAQIFIIQKWAQVWIADSLPAIRREIVDTIAELTAMGNWIQHVYDVASKGPRGESGKRIAEERVDELTGHPEAASVDISILLGRIDQVTADLAAAQSKLANALADNRAPIEVDDARDRVDALTAALNVLQGKLEEFKKAGPVTINLGAPAIDKFIVREMAPTPSQIVRESTTGAGQPSGTDTGAASRIQRVIDGLDLQAANLGRTNREQAIYNALAQAQVSIDSRAGELIAEKAGHLYDLTQAEKAHQAMSAIAAQQAQQEDQDRQRAHDRAQQLIEQRDTTLAGYRLEIGDREKLIASMADGARAYAIEQKFQEISHSNRLIEAQDARDLAERLVDLDRQQSQLTERTRFFRDAGMSAFSEVSGTLRSMFSRGEEAAGSFEDRIYSMLDKLEDAFWEFAVENPLKNLLFGADDSGNLLPTLADFVSGWFSSSSVGSSGGGGNVNTPQHRAGGGPVFPGHVYEINERGQELFMPGVPGTILPNQQLRQLGGSTSIQIIDQRSNGSLVQATMDRGPDGRGALRLWLKDEIKAALHNGVADGPLRDRFGLKRKGAA